ncbi:MAG: DUF1351 domain-containing protein, partial [Campylobacterota bacterium]|nr:DUF1351 domain-containing protein [Campylobacterota bacterium]
MITKDINISSTLPVINGNFEEIKIELQNQLKKFDLIVDEDSVKTAKSMATQINKMSKTIENIRKEEVTKLYIPIKKFEEKAKELTSLCQSSRQKLLSQVKVFEDKQREECKHLLRLELEASYLKYEIKKEFQSVEIDDLAIISNLNKSGLAKKAWTQIDERVFEAKKFQEKIDTRLLTLKGTSLSAGLKSSLNRENINHFLMEKDDSAYEQKLNYMIENELSRQEAMEKKIIEEQDRLQQQKATAKSIEVVEVKTTNAPKKSTKSTIPSSFKNNVFAKSAKNTYAVTATFEIEI